MALAELRGHWKTAILAYVLFYILLTLPAGLLDLIFGGMNGPASLITAGGGGESVFNLLNTDSGAFAEQQAQSLIALIYVLLIEGPLTLGLSGFMLAASRGATPGPGVVLDGFNNFFRAVGTYLSIALRVFLWCLPVIIAFSLLIAASFTMSLESFVSPSLLAVLPLFLVIALMVIVVRVMLTYSQAFFLLIDDPGRGVRDALRQSRNMMFGNKKKLLFLNLSFIGWYLLLYFAMILLIAFFVFMYYIPSIVILIAFTVLTGVLQAPLLAYLTVSGAVFYDIITGRRRFRPVDGGFFADESKAINDNEAFHIAAGEDRSLYGNAGEDRDGEDM
jgi:uncharacterized membrane protein